MESEQGGEQVPGHCVQLARIIEPYRHQLLDCLAANNCIPSLPSPWCQSWSLGPKPLHCWGPCHNWWNWPNFMSIIKTLMLTEA